MPSFPALAICRSNNGGYELVYCNSDWQFVTDTWHMTLEDAELQAEFEYQGVSATWIRNAGE